ncbi:MAG TPA: hypothetical protein VFS12_04920 [Terriglobia bacterium]|nr:hypothetical protein [Terriglobia bacterium]
MKPRWLGGPIEAQGLDEIVDFMVAIFIKQLCYQLHGWHGIPCWMTIFKGRPIGVASQGISNTGKICARRVTFGGASCQLTELGDALVTVEFAVR